VPQPIIGGHFIERNLNIVSGQPGAFKTIFMLEIVSAIALGRLAFGIYPVQQGRVAFITGDDPPEVVIDRLLMLNARIDHHRRVIDPDIRDMLHENVDVRTIDQVVSLRNRGVSRFVEGVLQGVAFAVLDPLRHFIGESDENKAHEVYAELAPLRALAARLPCAIAMVHHSKKDAGDAKMNSFRGSGAIRGLSRAMLHIERLNPGISPARIQITGENRYAEEPKPLMLEIENVGGKLLRFSRPDLTDSVFAAVTDAKAPISTNDIGGSFQEPISAIRAALYRLKEKGLLTSHKEGREVVWTRTSRVSTNPSGPVTKSHKHTTVTPEEREHTENL
jgi:hypothetical protein